MQLICCAAPRRALCFGDSVGVNLADEILNEVAAIMADPDLLQGNRADIEALLNSRGDTLDDEDILEMLRAIRESGSIWRTKVAGD